MKFRFAQNLRVLIVFFITLLVICELFAYVTVTPPPSEQFFQIYVLGGNHTAAQYFPGNSSDLKIAENVVWYVGVTNDMNELQLISIRIKASNMTIDSPNDTLGIQSPAPVLADFPRVLQKNETWELPLTWSVINATKANGVTQISEIAIGENIYHISEWSADGGYNFRLVFELWTWQADSNSFEFGWFANGGHHVAWLQVWFNMTNPVSGLQPPP